MEREAAARMATFASSQHGFRERWVAFWSNHFTVSVTRNQLMPFVGAYEREVIRPNAFARFEEILLAVVRHPAMLVYLDNTRSTGPESLAGMRGDRGLNENLAREILELHTLGVDGGYTQEDVLALSRLLTGWGMPRRGSDSRELFVFSPRRHEPGSKTLLGRTYPEGEQGGITALAALARHPSTARHVATKLAVHFVSDTPSPRLVKRLEQVFLETGGDLSALARALVRAPETWTATAQKVKNGRDLVISAARAVSYEGDGTDLLRAVTLLGQRPWSAPSPAGWGDETSDWMGPDALLARLDLAQRVAVRYAPDVGDPIRWAEDLLGATLSRQTVRVMRSASSSERAVALLLASPDFQRR